MPSANRMLAILLAAFAVLGFVVAAATAAEEDFAAWAPLQSEFESTGGGGIIIKGYNPVIVGSTCVTNFTATEPGGTVYTNIVEFDAVPTQGGTLCTNGRWRAVDGSANGTTPFRVFFKDGIVRRSP